MKVFAALCLILAAILLLPEITVSLSSDSVLSEGQTPMVDRKQITVSTITFALPDVNADVPRATKAENIEKARRLLDVAGERKSDVVCLPELFATKRSPNQAEAEPIPGGDISKMLSEEAKRWRMYVLGCLYEKRDGKTFNTVAIFDRAGKLVGTFSKVHLPAEEVDIAAPGNSFPVFKTDFGTIGALVCYDLHFPEAARVEAIEGADIIFWPTMYGEPRESMTEVLLRARAIENKLYMVSSNYAQGSGPHIGFSAIVSPYGEILANTGRKEGVATATINLDDKPSWPDITKERRPDAYGPLVEPR
jgi:predicted amidohydrolase